MIPLMPSNLQTIYFERRRNSTRPSPSPAFLQPSLEAFAHQSLRQVHHRWSSGRCRPHWPQVSLAAGGSWRTYSAGGGCLPIQGIKSLYISRIWRCRCLIRYDLGWFRCKVVVSMKVHFEGFSCDRVATRAPTTCIIFDRLECTK